VSQIRAIQTETINIHSKILVECFNERRKVVHENRKATNKTNSSKISKLLIKLRSNLITFKESKIYMYLLPTILNTP